MALSRYRRLIALKLYFAAGVALAGVLSLAAVSTHFAYGTREAASTLMIDGLWASSLASELELLLQQHRGLVESAPAELNRDRLAAMQRALHAVNDQLVAAGLQLQHANSGDVRALGQQLGRELPKLFADADMVMDLAADFVQDQALDTANGPYASAASLMQHQMSDWRGQRDLILKQETSALASSADELISRVLACSVAVLVFASLAALVGQQHLNRLERLKRSMLRLAAGDTEAPLPLLDSRDEIGAVAGAVQCFKDKAIRVAAQEAALTESTRLFEIALGNMSQGLCLYSSDGNLQICNRRFSEIVGIDHAKIRIGMSVWDVLRLSVQNGKRSETQHQEAWDALQAARLRRQSMTRVHQIDDGKFTTVSVRFLDDGGWVTTFEDVTARHVAEDKVTFMARHDPLTNRPNRAVLNEWLEQAVAQAGRGVHSAILCLGLDRFKAVNDTFGHPVGDALLRAVSDRLLALVREADMVARLGGDEFAIVQNNIQRPEDAKLLAERIVASLSEPFDIDGHALTVGVSVGVSLAPEDGAQAAKLLRNANLALYRAKAEGRGRFSFFEPSMDARLQTRRKLETDLRAALAFKQFELFYQPLVNLERAEVCGFEALLRWRHPEQGLVSPADFIPLLEDIGLIIPVGEWVIHQACADAALWPEDVKVAVNLSPAQFKSAHLAQAINRALVETGLPARRLELEITESVLLQDDEATLSTLHTVRDLGVKVAMDDFGTGYSSLSYLRSFPFDKVKIDQSFIRDLSDRKESVHVVRAVTRLCDGLGMATTAEGVETAEQLQTLRNEGCTEVQGYFFSRPKPAEHVASIIASVREIARSDHASAGRAKLARL